jgi:hypothetical protein
MPMFLAETQRHRFRSAQYLELLELTEQIDEQTELVPISSVDDVRLQDSGETVHGNYRLTHLAFRQVCQGMANGLTALVADLAGFRRKASADDSAISIPAAVRVYNLCLDLRCFMAGGPGNKQLICNSRAGVIDGLLGVGYRYLPHAALLEAANQSYTDVSDMPTIFSTAQLYGRRLEACWRTETPLFTSPTGESVYGGYQIVNSEAGECGVRASGMLLFGKNDVRCVKPTPMGQSLAHAGKNFRKKLGTLLGQSLAEGAELAEAGQRLTVLSQQPLRLVDQDGKLSIHRQRACVRILVSTGLPRSVAKEVVRHAIWAGTSDVVNQTASTEAIRKRTVYDLFFQLCRRAPHHHDFLRWQLEGVAYDVLSGKISF